MRVIVTRPAEDAAPLMARLAALGYEAIAAPLLEIRPIAGDVLDLEGVQAVLLTSANGVRAFAARSTQRDIAAYCVGDATARAARAVGFTDVHSADGDVEALAALVAAELDPHAGALLHPAGTKVAGDLAGRLGALGFTYRRAVVYAAVQVETLPPAACTALDGGVDGGVDGVLLYSPRTGAAFAKLVQAAERTDALTGVTAYCLSKAVADTVRGLAWRDIKIAPTPEQDALLALLD